MGGAAAVDVLLTQSSRNWGKEAAAHTILMTVILHSFSTKTASFHHVGASVT